MGQHGNIPPKTINMSAPKDYIDPKTMYRNTVDVIVTYEAGQAMYAEDDGFILYKGSGNYYNTDISVEKAIFDEGTIHTPTGKTGKEWNYKIYKGTTGQAIAQPKPGNFGAVFKEKCYGTVPGGLESGELIHKGCPFFVGNKTNGWFAGFAPYENPEIAIVVVVENVTHGGYTAEVARDIFAEYFGMNANEITETQEAVPSTQIVR